MKKESTKTILAVLFVIVVAAAFWLILLSPKRDQVNELKEQFASLSTELEAAQGQVQKGTEAKKNFSVDYAKLLNLGKAVPAEAATSSLLVELEKLGVTSKTAFKSIVLAGESEGEEATGESNELPPLGAKPGPSGFLAMPYSLEFEGGFFELAKALEKLNSLVTTNGGGVDARGRLITVDSFELGPGGEGEEASEDLSAHLSVNTYVTPPGQGLTSGASPAGPSNVSQEK